MSVDPNPVITSAPLELQTFVTEPSPVTRKSEAQNGIFEDYNVPRELNLETQASVQHTFPEGGMAAWLVVFGSAAVIGVTFGLASIVGIFQE